MASRELASERRSPVLFTSKKFIVEVSMLTPSFLFHALRTRALHGNTSPHKVPSNETFDFKLLHWLRLPERELLSILLESEKDAITAFCHPTIIDKLSLEDMLKIFVAHPVLSDQLIQIPIFQKLLNQGLTLEVLSFTIGDHKDSSAALIFLKKIKENPNFSDFNNRNSLAKEFMFFLLTLDINRYDKICTSVDFHHLDSPHAKRCLDYTKKMLQDPSFLNAIGRAPLHALKENFIIIQKAALQNTNLINELDKLPIADLVFLASKFPSIAEELLNNSTLLNRLTDPDLAAIGTFQRKFAEHLLLTPSLKEKLSPQSTLMLALRYSSVAEQLFEKMHWSDNLDDMPDICTFIGAMSHQPKVFKKILNIPSVQTLLNGDPNLSQFLKDPMSLYEAMQKICLDLRATLDSPSSAITKRKREKDEDSHDDTHKRRKVASS